MTRKWICLLLSAAFIFSLIPAQASAADYESAWFPAPVMNISQIAYENYSHEGQNAIDYDPGGDVVAPFTGRITYADARWGYVLFQSADKVRWADGSLDYMTVTFMHDENIDDLIEAKNNGTVIAQGTPFYQEGGMGGGNPNRYVDHVHMTVYRGHVEAGRSYGDGDEYVFDALFINPELTTEITGGGKGYADPSRITLAGAPSDYRELWRELDLGYLSQCVPYRSYGMVEVCAEGATVRSLPCTGETDPASLDVESCSKGAVYTVVGLSVNAQGTIWYKVRTQADSNVTGYLSAADTENFTQGTEDLTVTDLAAPEELALGKSFPLKGTVSAQYQLLYQLGVYAVPTSGTLTDICSEVTVNARRYVIAGSALDNNARFGKLDAGSYQYRLTATAASYYAVSPQELGVVYTDVLLHESAFQVIDDTVCQHTYFSAVTDPTCTEGGFTTYTCSQCAETYTDSYTDALGHSYTYSVRTVPTEAAEGALTGICIRCYDSTEVTLPALNETDYELTDGLYVWKITEYGSFGFSGAAHTPGDINGDGAVNNKDLTRLFQYLSGYEVEVVAAALDVNGDSSVNNKDLTRLFQYLSGYDVEIV